MISNRIVYLIQLAIRNAGKWSVRHFPLLDGAARSLYRNLPVSFHDSPTSRASYFFTGEHSIQFFQIGAYDGITGDPLRRLVLENPEWRGVMIEPQAPVFFRLKENYASQSDRLTLLNCAVSETPGNQSFYFISEEERVRRKLPEWVSEIASFNPKHVRKYAKGAKISSS